MAQGGDVDRELDGYDHVWTIKCDVCKKLFTATRYDATYCSAKCRKRRQREAEQLDKRLVELQLMSLRVSEIAREYPQSQRVLDQVQILKASVTRSLEIFDVPWKPEKLLMD